MNNQRRLIVVVICMMMSSFALAQTFTQPGTIELGGDISFSSQTRMSNASSSGSALTIFSFNPYLGFMVTDGFELGLMPGITTLSSGGSQATALNLFFAPAYNIKTNGNVYPYFEFLIGYNSISDNYSSFFGGAETQTRGGLGIGLDAGLKLNVKGNSLLLFKIQYLRQSYKQDGYTVTTNYGFGASTTTVEPIENILTTVSFGMGFRIFIERKEKKK